MLLKIPRLYDSHTHFIATGQFSGGLHLGSMTKVDSLKAISLQNPSYFRNDWLVGFGFDETKWQDAEPFGKALLDKIFPNTPVFFARMDGHSSWYNTLALQRLKVSSDSGVLTEKDHLKAWDLLPAYTFEQERAHVLSASQLFNKEGFTHVRDMSCTESQWQTLVRMSDAGELTLAIEENFTSHDPQDFEKTLALATYAKKNETKLVRAKGIKVFYDGSLGSETALLSKSYHGKSSCGCGRSLWNITDIEELMKKTWAAGLEFSIHAIGDEASHQIIQSARKISAQGSVGRLNLEHAQVLRPETIQMMKPLHVRCHMQPCHWLSDRSWLKDKLGDLYAYAFPWEALRLAQIPISFGSDSPVEAPSFFKNQLALQESSEHGIKKWKGDTILHHSHPDAHFAGASYTVIEDQKVKEVIFEGQSLTI